MLILSGPPPTMDEATREAIYEVMLQRAEDPQVALERHRRATANMGYSIQHTEEWRVRYPDQYIAAYDCQLIAAARTLGQVRRAVRNAKIPFIECDVRFLTKERQLWML